MKQTEIKKKCVKVVEIDGHKILLSIKPGRYGEITISNGSEDLPLATVSIYKPSSENIVSTFVFTPGMDERVRCTKNFAKHLTVI